MEERKAKLLIGIMYSDKKLLKKVLGILEERFGEIEDYIDYRFNFTKYYEKEMGKNLRKRIVVFEKLININRLAI